MVLLFNLDVFLNKSLNVLIVLVWERSGKTERPEEFYYNETNIDPDAARARAVLRARAQR